MRDVTDAPASRADKPRSWPSFGEHPFRNFDKTTICLKRSQQISPFVVSLDIDTSVYLHSFEIEPNPRARTRLLSRARTSASALWRDLICFEVDTREARIGVKWVTTGSAACQCRYCLTRTPMLVQRPSFNAFRRRLLT